MTRLEVTVASHPGKKEFRQDEERDALRADEHNGLPLHIRSAAAPDAVDRLKSAGMQVVTRIYPHNWSYQLNFVKGPFTDIRIRKAANYAINRPDVVELLGGTAIAGYSTAPPGMPYYGNPVKYEYDPAKATALLKEAGCYPCKVNFAISTSGSGPAIDPSSTAVNTARPCRR